MLVPSPPPLPSLQAGADKRAIREAMLGAARRFFRPELLNRLDDVVVFEPLGASQVRAFDQALTGR